MKSRSSIFSFDAVERGSFPGHWWASIALLAGLLVAAELGARFLLRPIGEHLWAYDSTALSRSFEWYRQQSLSGTVPPAVAIGDSVGARNFDPAAFGRTAGIDDVYSLARAANFPRALRSNTLPLLDTGTVPDIVILLQSPSAFRDDPRTDQIEAGMVSPILEARLDGTFLVTDVLFVTRLFRARSYLLDYWLRDEPLVRRATNDGFSPFDREAGDPRLAPARPPDEAAVFSEARRQVVIDLVEIARRRGFTIYAVVSPHRFGLADEVSREHLEWLRGLAPGSCGALTVIDLRELPELDTGQFKDNHHLYRDGAAVFSEALGRIVAKTREHPEETGPGCPQSIR